MLLPVAPQMDRLSNDVAGFKLIFRLSSPAILYFCWSLSCLPNTVSELFFYVPMRISRIRNTDLNVTEKLKHVRGHTANIKKELRRGQGDHVTCIPPPPPPSLRLRRGQGNHVTCIPPPPLPPFPPLQKKRDQRKRTKIVDGNVVGCTQKGAITQQDVASTNHVGVIHSRAATFAQREMQVKCSMNKQNCCPDLSVNRVHSRVASRFISHMIHSKFVWMNQALANLGSSHEFLSLWLTRRMLST